MNTNRRNFLSVLSASAASTLLPSNAPAAEPSKRIALGIDNFAVRAFGWKAPQLIEYAASLQLDTLFLSDLECLPSLEEGSLKEIKAMADAKGLALYVGSWSICPSSVRFKPNWGSAEEHLKTGIRVAKTLGSPVFRVILGGMDDRKTPGGIGARIDDTLQVLKTCKSAALNAGVKIAVENHAGDMHSWELRELIETAGRDFVGANIDSGNAIWTLEDPMDVLETLGPVTLCSSLRDNMAWETPDGAAVQWTAVGEGLIDWKAYAARWAQLCPATPIMIETISGGPRMFPYKQPDFWRHYDRRPEKLAKFEALMRRGRQIPAFKAPSGPEGRQATQEFQRAELEKSIAHLREKVGIGLRA